jgi:Glutamine amidotransferases class-II
MIVAPTSRGRLSFRHVMRNLKVQANLPSRMFQYRHFSSYSTVVRRYGQPKLMAVSLLDNILTYGWKNPTKSVAIATNRSLSTSSSVMTNKILDWKTGGRGSSKKTLYDPSRETENCGVGLIASLKSVPSRDIIQKADEMLVRMAHRGGCGCDPASGDGSGMYNLE